MINVLAYYPDLRTWFHREVSSIVNMLYSNLVVGRIKRTWPRTYLQNFTWPWLCSLSSRIWVSVLHFIVVQFGYLWDGHSHFISELKPVNYQESQPHYKRTPAVWMERFSFVVWYKSRYSFIKILRLDCCGDNCSLGVVVDWRNWTFWNYESLNQLLCSMIQCFEMLKKT